MWEDTNEEAAFLRQFFQAVSIEEGLALSQLFQESPQLFRPIQDIPAPWGPCAALCTRCWQALANESGFCPLCTELKIRVEAIGPSNRRRDTGVWISSQDTICHVPLAQDTDDHPFPISLSERESLVFLSRQDVESTLICLYQAYKDRELYPVTLIVPLRGRLKFGEVLALTRHYAELIRSPSDFGVKFFFSHSQLGSLEYAYDRKAYLEWSLLEKLFEAAHLFKERFAAQDLKIILGALRKNELNRHYDLGRLYSLCNVEQKALMDRFDLFNIDSQRGALLFQLVNYVS